mmetsp:Transcript_5109/g.14082  ORF Transcript_5109/g.14082 Transcript_5109/m.14082 type:complete len:219 (-) Transcript_5109:281-937(-)
MDAARDGQPAGGSGGPPSSPGQSCGPDGRLAECRPLPLPTLPRLPCRLGCLLAGVAAGCGACCASPCCALRAVLGVRGIRSVVTGGVSKSPLIAASSSARIGFRPWKLPCRVPEPELGRGRSAVSSSSSEMLLDDASPSVGTVVLVTGEMASCLHATASGSAASNSAAGGSASNGSAPRPAPPRALALQPPPGAAGLIDLEEGEATPIEPKMHSQKAS